MPLTQLHLTRRQALAYAAAGTGVGLLNGCSTLFGGPTKITPGPAVSAIDVHCHIFNATDLPVNKFIRLVYAERYGFGGTVVDGLIDLTQQILDTGAPTAAVELAELEGRKDRRYVPVDRATRQAERDALVKTLVGAAVKNVHNQVYTPQQSGPGRHPYGPALSADQVREMRRQLLEHLKTGKTENLENSQSTPTDPPIEVLQDKAVAMYGTNGGPLMLASLVTLKRSELIEHLYSLPAHSGEEIRFFAPALVDFGKWLGESLTGRSHFEEQIEVMAAISRLPAPYLVHGWGAFCPWRQIDDTRPKTQLDNLKEAVEKKGFIGVKMYPPMGFYPLGNEQKSKEEEYPPGLESKDNFGKLLDGALRDLYRWCEAEEVPILAHSGHSNYPVDRGYGQGFRAAPDNWKPVLAEFPRLRVNLGHCGGIWSLGKGNEHEQGRFWPQQVFNLMNTQVALKDQSKIYPAVFADFADYSEIIEGTGSDACDDARITGQVKAMVSGDQGGRARSQLMYGTDWIFLSMAAGSENYYPAMRDRMPQLLGLSAPERVGYLGQNAARFIGLAKNPDGTRPKTRQRLERFHEKDSAKLELLKTFDPV